LTTPVLGVLIDPLGKYPTRSLRSVASDKGKLAVKRGRKAVNLDVSAEIVWLPKAMKTGNALRAFSLVSSQPFRLLELRGCGPVFGLAATFHLSFFPQNPTQG
jgi:hypothetical protein